jgi:hypothetical protein
MRRTSILAFGLVMLYPVSVRAQVGHSDDAATIRALSSQERPPRASTAIFWSGAYPKPILGQSHSAFRAAQAARFATRQNQSSTHETIRLEIASAGDMAYEFFNFTLSFDNSVTKGHVSFPGSGLRVWKKNNGRWEIVADMVRPWDQMAAQ